VKPDISIVIPAFNESERLGAPLRKVLAYLADDQPNGEVIVVDDGSSDDTSQVARTAFDEFSSINSQVVRYETNRGKGFAVRTGLKASAADIALFSDADLSTPIDEMTKLVDPILSGEFDVTFGSRALDRSLIGTHQPWQREQGGRAILFPLLSAAAKGRGVARCDCTGDRRADRFQGRDA